MTSGRRFKDSIYEQFARIGKAVGSPRRLELLDLLCQGPRTVEVLARAIDQSVANTSQHLQVLRRARMVEAEREGVLVTYRLANDEVGELFRSLRYLAESRLADVERVTREFLEERGSLEPLDWDALLERMRAGEVMLLDLRPPEEYRAAHIPGAISVPQSELARRLTDLPRDREIVAYCRGPYCVLAIEAVALLRKQGFDAVRLKEGVPDWRARGLPVAIGDEVGSPAKHEKPTKEANESP
jgi:rhodanese-related sulfurtransferase